MAESLEPTVGDLFRVAWDGKHKGWTQEQSGTEDGRGYVVFSLSNRYIIAFTRILESKNDGTGIQEILQVFPAIREPKELHIEASYCGFIDKEPVLAFKSPATGIIRGYFIAYKEVIVKRWLADARQPCIGGGD
jgi:hypothetical protein